jgi:hypothetical protein
MLSVNIAVLWDMMSCSLVSETWKEPAASVSKGYEPDGSSETFVNFHQIRGITSQNTVIFNESSLPTLFYPAQDEIPLLWAKLLILYEGDMKIWWICSHFLVYFPFNSLLFYKEKTQEREK